MNYIIVLTSVLLLWQKSQASALAEGENIKDLYLLNNEVTPTKYTVDLELPDNFGLITTFSGKVEITFTPLEGTTKKTIKLHIKKITLGDIEVIRSENKGEDVRDIYERHTEDSDIEMVTITLKEVPELKKDVTYKIVIKYEGILHDDMFGLYRSSYIDEDGIIQWIATTQFQPTHARRAFPCFDEPDKKAVFYIIITHSNAYHAISNALVDTTHKVATNRIKTTFKKTPQISTYLIAFVVSKFSKLSQTVKDIQHGLYAPIEMIGSGQYSFTIAPKVLDAMHEFTGVPYSVSNLNKLDQVSIPDFSAGAMENWGLVTYRETALLWNFLDSSAKNKERVATVVAHELAHMWFGNLITLQWWSSAWLNEGFARLFQYRAAAKVEKTWELEDQLVIEQQQAIFIQDSTDGVQPLTSDAYTPAEISSKFGSITYNKGASILRMMEHMIGPENFIKGLKEYFSAANHFKNTTPEKLWAAMSTEPPLGNPHDTLENIMKLWTEKGGYPVVTVSIHKDDVIQFNQTRFFFNSANTTDFKWHVPISYTTSVEKKFDATAPRFWLSPDKTETLEGIQINDSWIVVNIKETAYIRVKYDDVLYDRLEKALTEENFDGIHVLNRAQIVDDAMNLARGSYITYNRALGLIDYLANEQDYYPWFSAFNAFAFLKRRTDSTSETATYLDKHILNLMQNVYKSTEFEQQLTDQIGTHKKTLVLSWACLLGDAECVNKSQSTFKSLKDYNEAVDPNIRSVVYCTELRNSNDRNSWDYLWEKFQYSRWAPESVTILTALGCSKNKEILREYLEKSINPYSGIRNQDALSVFQAVIAGNPEGVEVGLEFLKSSFQDIIIHYGSMNALTTVITSLADRLTTKEQIDELEEFIKLNEEDLKDAAVIAENAVAAARENLVWFKEHEEEILTYLKEHQPKPGSGILIHASALLISIFIFIIRLC